MTDRLAEIRARLDAATSGPWVVTGRGSAGCAVVGRTDAEVTGMKWGVIAWPTRRPRNAAGEALASLAIDRNAEFIAHAPADIAWLLDEVERMRECFEVMRHIASRTVQP